jgi:hypothetical protein
LAVPSVLLDLLNRRFVHKHRAEDRMLHIGKEFLSPSPRRYVQFKVLLKSDTPFVAPTLNMLRLHYTDSFLNGAFGEVTPKEARVGEPENFTYLLQPDFANGDRGFNRLRLDTPSQIALESLAIRVDGDRANARLGRG